MTAHILAVPMLLLIAATASTPIATDDGQSSTQLVDKANRLMKKCQQDRTKPACDAAINELDQIVRRMKLKCDQGDKFACNQFPGFGMGPDILRVFEKDNLQQRAEGPKK